MRGAEWLFIARAGRRNTPKGALRLWRTESFLGMGKEGEKGRKEEKRRLFIELEIWARVE